MNHNKLFIFNFLRYDKFSSIFNLIISNYVLFFINYNYFLFKFNMDDKIIHTHFTLKNLADFQMILIKFTSSINIIMDF